jgi:hydroxyethylthiazole kinase-like uncharacterized protein yjeF
MDRLTIDEIGIPGVVLMENAGRAAAMEALDLLTAVPEPAAGVLIAAGKGNNGGDGFVIARHLINHGLPVEVVFLGDLSSVSLTSDAGINLFVLMKMGLLIKELDERTSAGDLTPRLARRALIVDALLGTGATGTLRAPYDAVIDAINTSGRPVLAVDLPSGLDSDTGRTLGAAIRATRTVTFGLAKPGFYLAEGPEHCGKIVVADISIPEQVVEKVLGAWRVPRPAE